MHPPPCAAHKYRPMLRMNTALCCAYPLPMLLTYDRMQLRGWSSRKTWLTPGAHSRGLRPWFAGDNQGAGGQPVTSQDSILMVGRRLGAAAAARYKNACLALIRQKHLAWYLYLLRNCLAHNDDFNRPLLPMSSSDMCWELLAGSPVAKPYATCWGRFESVRVHASQKHVVPVVAAHQGAAAWGTALVVPVVAAHQIRQIRAMRLYCYMAVVLHP